MVVDPVVFPACTGTFFLGSTAGLVDNGGLGGGAFCNCDGLSGRAGIGGAEDAVEGGGGLGGVTGAEWIA